MKLSVKQQDVISRLLPYCGGPPTDSDIEAFFALTDRGINPDPFGPELRFFTSLCWAHARISKGYDQVQEEMWLDGVGDCPLLLMLIDYLDIPADLWPYNTGIFTDWYNFIKRMYSGDSYWGLIERDLKNCVIQRLLYILKNYLKFI